MSLMGYVIGIRLIVIARHNVFVVHLRWVRVMCVTAIFMILAVAVYLEAAAVLWFRGNQISI